MDWPDSIVQNLVHQIKNDFAPENQLTIINKIKELSDFKRCQLFCLIKDFDNFPSEAFSLESNIWKNIHNIFKAEYSESSILVQNIEHTLKLAENALIFEIFDLEDYRSIIRFLYSNGEEFNYITYKINQSILNFLNSKGTGSQIVSKFHSMLHFLGIPLANIVDIEGSLIKLFPEAESEIMTFLELPISTIQKYPEYLEEAVDQLNYDESVPMLKKWLNNDVLSRIETLKVNQFINKWQPKAIKTTDDLVINLETELLNMNLTSIPLVYNSFIKPYCTLIEPKQILPTELNANIPSEILQSYIEKLAFPITAHREKYIQIFFLGGATIGTMGILICTPKSNLLIDYGMSVANYQIPYWNEALNHLDGILVTHAHLDHIGAIPCLFGQGYEGFVFGSAMTKNFTNLLLFDSLELMKKNINSSVRGCDHRFKVLTQTQYIYKMLDHYITIKPQNELQLSPDIVVKPISAHHIQGSYSYTIECEDKKILFTGDFNMDPTTLFKNKSPELPKDADLTIVDGTYYGQPAFNTHERDKLLYRSVRESDKVIIPAFSVGRAQEILIKLEKAGITKDRQVIMLGMATKVARLTGLKTHGYLSDYLTKPFEEEVVISGGGMVNGGYARELIEQTKDDPSTTIILCGYLAKTTLGYRLLHGLEPEYKQKVVFTRFSGHSSSDSLVKYLDSVQGKKVLVHIGELTKDPFKSEDTRKLEAFTQSNYHIPSLGSSIQI
jgi:Cft2 family RNA processing exonuclease